MNSQAVVPAKTITAVEWEGLSLCRVLRKKDLQFTDRLTQENCKLTTMTIFCSGGKSPSFFLLSRSGNEWLVGRENDVTQLKANVGDNSFILNSRRRRRMKLGNCASLLAPPTTDTDTDTDTVTDTYMQDPLIPPTTGWQFRNGDTGSYEEDRQLRCSSTPTSSCSVTVSLIVEAEEYLIVEECEGRYKDTGLRSRGRKVINFSI